jgi:putative hydrolase of HD superfamily
LELLNSSKKLEFFAIIVTGDIMENQIKNALSFYYTATKLKYLIRSGWLKWNISKERLESVAEHIYGTCILAIAIESEIKYDVNLDRVMKMLVLHELEEIIIGDITPHDNVSDEKKYNDGMKAVDEILSPLFKKDEYYNLIDEFNKKETKDGKFAQYCDKLEADLQAKYYHENGFSNIYSQENKSIMESEKIINLLKNGSTNLPELFIDYDMAKFDETFSLMADFIKKMNMGMSDENNNI